MLIESARTISARIAAHKRWGSSKESLDEAERDLRFVKAVRLLDEAEDFVPLSDQQRRYLVNRMTRNNNVGE